MTKKPKNEMGDSAVAKALETGSSLSGVFRLNSVW